MSFVGIVACQVGNVFACRSEHQSVFRLGLGGNRAVIAGVLVEVGLLFCLLYLPALATLFHLTPPGPAHWLLLATFGPCLLALEEARKTIRRRFLPRPSGN
jgi:magnesium-transporting ATPase (P-type)